MTNETVSDTPRRGRSSHGFQKLARPMMAQTNGGSRFEPIAWEGRTTAETLHLAAPVVARPPRRMTDGRHLENRIGREDRIRVAQTVKPPFCAIAHLSIGYANGAFAIGTGWFYAPHSLATAAHNLHHPAHGPATDILVAPGWDGMQQPFGAHPAASWETPEVWQKGFAAVDDYGAIGMPAGNPLGRKVGAFGIGVLPDRMMPGLAANMAGYPADVHFLGMYYQADRLTRFTGTEIFYDIDTSEGMSGAPIYGIFGEHDRIAIGIHTTGHDTGNSGRRIDGTAFDFLSRFRR